MNALIDRMQLSGCEDQSGAAFFSTRTLLKSLFFLLASTILVAFGPAAFTTISDVSFVLLQISLDVCRISLFVLHVFIS